MFRYLIQIDGLRLDSSWEVGPVWLRDADEVARIVDHRLTLLPEILERFTRDDAAHLKQGVAAEVVGSSVDDAIQKTRDALDLLRVFQQSIAIARTASFGVAGDAVSARTLYLPLDEAAGVGWRGNSVHLGSHFDEVVKQKWASSRFAQLADLQGQAALSTGPARAILAIRLLSQAVLEQRPSLRLLGTAIAIEALLGGGGKAFELARRAAFFTCGEVDGNLCGRDRPACDFLRLDPRTPSELKRLRKLADLARKDTHFRCSEWLDVVGRYADRSSIAHGDPSHDIHPTDADSDLFWAIRRLLPSALAWLLDHPDEPMEQVDQQLARLRTRAAGDTTSAAPSAVSATTRLDRLQRFAMLANALAEDYRAGEVLAADALRVLRHQLRKMNTNKALGVPRDLWSVRAAEVQAEHAARGEAVPKNAFDEALHCDHINTLVRADLDHLSTVEEWQDALPRLTAVVVLTARENHSLQKFERAGLNGPEKYAQANIALVSPEVLSRFR